MRKVYVTGAAGMIGSNLVDSLISSGVRVVGVDNFWRGSEANLANHMTSDLFEFRYADLCEDRSWYSDMQSSDCIIHVADIVAGIGYVFNNEWAVYQKNVAINSAVATVVRDKQPERLIYLGTACSYPQGMQRSVSASRLKENDKFPADPESGYGWSKLLGEIEFNLALKDKSTKLITLDLHNVFGWPCVYKDPTSQVIPSLIFKAINSDSGVLEVWGNGEQGRGFVHVSDVVSAILKAIEYKGAESSFMIGPDQCTTIKYVAELLRLNKHLPIHQIEYDTAKPTGDIGRYADFSLARKELGWRPRACFEKEIENLVEMILADNG